jgi:tripartite-type tricarboxylate transporter receptor subunit TctC
MNCKAKGLSLSVGCWIAVMTLPAVAAPPLDGFAGKTVTYIVATRAGGGTDAYGRLTSEFMEKYLPGSTFIVKNVAGAGGLIGAAAIYAAKPDGLTLGTFSIGLLYGQLGKNKGVKFDLGKMSWIGKAASDGRVIVVNANSPIKSFQDLFSQKEPVKFATGGVGGNLHSETTMLSSVFHIPARILSGYHGNEDQMAMRRGEIDAALGSRSSFDEFVASHYGRFIVQIGGKDPAVPQLSSFAKDAQAKSLVSLIQSQGELGRLTVGPPKIPAPQLTALREAYKKAMEDKALQAKAAKLHMPLDPAYGEEVEAAVKDALHQPPEVMAMLEKLLSKAK